MVGLIAIALTLCAVFVPTSFMSGISGLFFKQFAITISASTAISCFVSSPAATGDETETIFHAVVLATAMMNLIDSGELRSCGRV
jgi:hypothetical protein